MVSFVITNQHKSVDTHTYSLFKHESLFLTNFDQRNQDGVAISPANTVDAALIIMFCYQTALRQLELLKHRCRLSVRDRRVSWGDADTEIVLKNEQKKQLSRCSA